MSNTKQNISAETFDKKVEVEAAYLMHFSNFPKEKADKVAKEIVSEKFAKA